MKTLLNIVSIKAVVAAALSQLLALPVYAATFNLNPSADAFVTTGPSGNLSGNNYGAFSFNGATSGAATYTLSLTPGFAASALAGGFASFRLLAADSVVSFLFDSRDFGSASARPSLSMVAIPEPAASPLFAAFAALLFAARYGRRRHHQ